MSDPVPGTTPDPTREIPKPPDDARTAGAATEGDLTTPIAVRTTRGPQPALVIVAIAAAAFLIGLAIGTITSEGAEGTIVATSDVGPAGGTVRFDGGQIVFPQGAVTDEIHVVVRTLPVDERLRIDEQPDPIIIDPGELQAYRFEPVDATFAEPVEITFRLPRGARRGTVFARYGGETTLLRGSVDIARSTATVRVRDFRFHR